MVTVAERKETKRFTVQRGQEIVVKRRNDVGILSEISTLLSEKDVNILGLSAGVCGEDCLIRLLTDDNRQTKGALVAKNFTCEEADVILVEMPHRPGMLKQITKRLSQEGIDIRHAYAAAAKGQDKGLLVLHTSNDQRALTKLEEFEGD